jgi:hypothetical protein
VSPRRLARRVRASWVSRQAARWAAREVRERPASIRICWDLDNTLVGSGRLLREGLQLQEAVVDAKPVPNMLAFFDAMRRRFPDAEHFILSARASGMQADTLAWLEEHGLALSGGAICLVPSADAKRGVWQQLARDCQLVIVDDLSYGHEGDEAVVYDELAAFAGRTASVYIGLDEIARIEADPDVVQSVADRAAEALARN